MQSCSWTRAIREPEPYEIDWQFYTMMSFGAVHFGYYVFSSRERHSGCMLDCRGDQTKIYWAAKDMADAIFKMEDVYLSYRSLGAFNVNYSDEVKCLALEKPYLKFDTIKEIESDTPLLVGCFEKKESEGLYDDISDYAIEKLEGILKKQQSLAKNLNNFGSFYNVVGWRLPIGLSIVRPSGSFCPNRNLTKI